MLHILIADDDEDDCTLMSDALEEMSAAVSTDMVEDGASLMRTLKTASGLPDIIFLDVNMPFKNGIECLKEIRQEARLKHLPVIIFSTSGQQWAIDEAFELGANLFVRKPESFAKLRSVITYILSVNWKTARQPAKSEFLVA